MPARAKAAPSRARVPGPRSARTSPFRLSAIATHSKPAFDRAPSLRPALALPSSEGNIASASSKRSRLSATTAPAWRKSSLETLKSPAMLAVWLALAAAPASLRPAR